MNVKVNKREDVMGCDNQVYDDEKVKTSARPLPQGSSEG